MIIPALLPPLVFVMLSPTSAVAGPDARTDLWVASRDGRTVEEAQAAGAVVLEAMPDALVLGDAASARALRESGFAVDGPLSVPEGATVLLLASRRDVAVALDRATLSRAPGLRVLWVRSDAALVATDRPLPTSEPFLELQPRVLAWSRLRASRPAPSARATIFDPRIDAVIAPVDSFAYFPWIRRLSGAEPVLVGGQSVTFTTRYTLSSQCDLAEQYVYERFAALGFDQVEYDPYLAYSTPARNVIATQIGTETPQQVVIICGHLDSTSPQASTNAPGANDNASGTAGVLTAAQAMRPWRFKSTIRFIAFTGEEQGELGSEHYAELEAASPDSILGVVNLDMIAWWSYRRQIDVEGSPFCAPIMNVMADACARYTAVGTIFTFNPWGSDHVPFSQRGMPSFLAIESDWANYPCYHRTCDTWDRNLGGFGAEVVKAAIATAAQLAELDVASPAPVVASDRPLALEAWPCPFAGALTIRVPASRAGARDLSVHDVLGRRVRTLDLGSRVAAPQDVAWDGRADDGRALPGGVYFVRLVGDGRVSAVKVIRRS